MRAGERRLREYALRWPLRGAARSSVPDGALNVNQMSHWRMGVALALWVGGFFLPLGIPLVVGLPLPVGTRTALAGLLVFGLPQLLTLVAIALVGTSGFHYLKDRLFGAARRLGPPAHVSRLRYRVGLIMLFLPLAVSLLEPYLTLLVVTEYLPHWMYGAVNDTLFLMSFFVLGGAFWDKVKALFVYEATAVFPVNPGPR